MVFSYEFPPIEDGDIEELTGIMKRAFNEDARLFFNKPAGGPPGYDDGSFLKKWANDPGTTALKIVSNGTLVGAIIFFLSPENSKGFLGNMFVDPMHSGTGAALAAWNHVENSHPEITLWETETPAVSYRNHRFYINKCGFKVHHVSGGADRFSAMFHLRKSTQTASA